MFRGAGSEGEGVGAIEVSVCGQWIFRCAGKVCFGARATYIKVFIKRQKSKK